MQEYFKSDLSFPIAMSPFPKHNPPGLVLAVHIPFATLSGLEEGGMGGGGAYHLAALALE